MTKNIISPSYMYQIAVLFECCLKKIHLRYLFFSYKCEVGNKVKYFVPIQRVLYLTSRDKHTTFDTQADVYNRD
jgi:hypothetical protein